MKITVVLLALIFCGITQAEDLFATVGNEEITRAQFEAHVEAGLRQKYYHGKVPEAQLRVFREEMAQQLIDRVLLVQEAQRRGYQPQKEQVNREIEKTRQRYRHNPAWQQQGKAMLEQLRTGTERQDLIAQLRQAVMQKLNQELSLDDEPDAVRHYYLSHAEQFTTPQRLRLSLIMLAVDAWAPQTAWQAAEEEAARLVLKLRSGKAEFSALARLHSSDASAANGGDLGFIHVGMLAREVQQHVETLTINTIAEPIRLLQGIAVFRLDGREVARLNTFEKVRERVGDLYRRQRQQQGWLHFLEGLRQRTPLRRYDVHMSDDSE